MTHRRLQPAHEVKVVNGVPKLVKENFTVEFRGAERIPVIMQDGACFDAGGNLLESPPEWVWEAFSTLSEDAKAALKMTPPKAK